MERLKISILFVILLISVSCETIRGEKLPGQYLLAEEVLDARVYECQLNDKTFFGVALSLNEEAARRFSQYDYDTEFDCINGDFRITMINQNPASSHILRPYTLYQGSIITDGPHLPDVMRAIGR